MIIPFTFGILDVNLAFLGKTSLGFGILLVLCSGGFAHILVCDDPFS